MNRRTATTWLLAALCATATHGLWAQPVERSRFAVVDVYVDSNAPVAAWQFELRERRGLMQVVGIEGGEGQGFHEPPFYDRRAVAQGNSDRVIVASYSLTTPAQLPSGRVRVASVHVRLLGEAAPDYDLRLIAAGTADGRVIDAKISLETRGR
jgi:hypothetical protein